MSVDLTGIRGDTGTYTLALLDAAGEPFDLTGADVFFTVGDRFTKSIGDGVEIDADPTTGVVTVTLLATDTDGYPDTRTSDPYALRVELDAGDIVVTPQRGRFIVEPVPEPLT